MILEIEDFISPDLCQKIIQISKNKGLTAMGVLGHDNSDRVRVADGTWLYQDDLEEYKNIKKYISEIINVPEENQENPNIVMYPVGGEYKYHHDFFHFNTEYYDMSIARGGQRSYTCVIYLNDGYAGGETSFFHNQRTVSPKIGKLLCWSNLYEDGTLDFDSLHAGLPVTEGEKWIYIIFVREKEFH